MDGYMIEFMGDGVVFCENYFSVYKDDRIF